MAPNIPKAILNNMYEKAQWTDLKIITSTKTFNVHKSVVCATSDYFATACQLAQKAGKITTIKVPEDEIVIDAILQHCYGISEALYHDCQCETITETCELKRMEILVAADKYQLPALKEAIQQELRLQYTDWGATPEVAMGLWAYQEGRRQILGPRIVKDIVQLIARDMGEILNQNEQELDKLAGDPTDWEKLQSCPELMMDVMREISMNSTSCTGRPGGDWTFYESDYLLEPEANR